jgi:lysophospholipase L1-like esterase
MSRRYVDLRSSKIIFDGNSLTEGASTGAGAANISSQVSSQLINRGIRGVSIVNVGVGGQNCAQMIVDGSSQVAPLREAGRDNIVVVNEGGNDIYFGATAAQAFQNIRDYCLLRRAEGFYVLVWSCLHRNNGFSSNPTGDPSGFQAALLDFNNRLERGWKEFADAYMDTRKHFPYIPEANFPDNGGFWFPDCVHPSATGNAILAAKLIEHLKRIPQRQFIYQSPSLPPPTQAYSLKRRMVSGYTGFAARIRRSSDNALLNVGFNTNGGVDTAAMLTFCGAGNGSVDTIYDQSGNQRHLSQSIAGAQPTIVSSGALVTMSNGDPAAYFDSFNNFMAYEGALSVKCSFHVSVQVWTYNPGGAANIIRGIVLFYPPAGQLDYASSNALLLYHDTTGVTAVSGANSGDGFALADLAGVAYNTANTNRSIYGVSLNDGAAKLRVEGTDVSSDPYVGILGKARGMAIGARTIAVAVYIRTQLV